MTLRTRVFVHLVSAIGGALFFYRYMVPGHAGAAITFAVTELLMAILDIRSRLKKGERF
jgi:hypothetical protein